MVQPAVLVVDDEPAVRRLLTVLLSDAGFTVVGAASGPEAVELYRTSPSDIVLMELRTAGMDGVATLAALQAMDPGVRCCFMSASSGSYKLMNLYERGALAFLPKPFSSVQDLVKLLRGFL